MTTDLEDRLRTQAQKIADEGYHRWSELCVEVADALGSQADRIQALEAKCALLAASLAQEEAKCAELERGDDVAEAREILTLLIRSIEKHGPYSAQATCTFIQQALNCLSIAAQAGSKEEKQK